MAITNHERVGKALELLTGGLKPFVERSVRTLKYECLWEAHPENPVQADAVLREYRYFYNHQRANQSSACQNRPPYEAFPNLPIRRSLPEEVDPDAWLDHYHRSLFKRRVGPNGMVSIDFPPASENT